MWLFTKDGWDIPVFPIQMPVNISATWTFLNLLEYYLFLSLKDSHQVTIRSDGQEYHIVQNQRTRKRSKEANLSWHGSLETLKNCKLEQSRKCEQLERHGSPEQWQSWVQSRISLVSVNNASWKQDLRIKDEVENHYNTSG